MPPPPLVHAASMFQAASLSIWENGSSAVENLVIATELKVVSEEMLLADLTLHTVEGAQTFGINEECATGLIDILEKFLRRKPDDNS